MSQQPNYTDKDSQKMQSLLQRLMLRGSAITVIGLGIAFLVKPYGLPIGTGLLGVGGLFWFAAGCVKVDMIRAQQDSGAYPTNADLSYTTSNKPSRNPAVRVFDASKSVIFNTIGASKNMIFNTIREVHPMPTNSEANKEETKAKEPSNRY
jgi:hypothetical protein